MAANQLINFLETATSPTPSTFPAVSLEPSEGLSASGHQPQRGGHARPDDLGVRPARHHVVDMINKSRGAVAYNLLDLQDEPTPGLIDELCRDRYSDKRPRTERCRQRSVATLLGGRSPPGQAGNLFPAKAIGVSPVDGAYSGGKRQWYPVAHRSRGALSGNLSKRRLLGLGWRQQVARLTTPQANPGTWLEPG